MRLNRLAGKGSWKVCTAYRRTLRAPEIGNRQRARSGVRSAVALAITAASVFGTALGQGGTVSLQLKPREPQTLVASLPANEMALVHLHLHGGIIGVREIAPDGSSRPLWLIDLGRGAELTYVRGGASTGNYTLEITSFEKAKPVEVSLEVDDASPATAKSKDLRDAEDLLANADLIRRHWPTAPVGVDAIGLYDRALALAAKLDDIRCSV